MQSIKVKKPLYKRWWFWLIVPGGLVILLIQGSIIISVLSTVFSGITSTPSRSSPAVAVKHNETDMAEYKKQCKPVNFDNLARDTESYIDKKVKFTGEVIQVQEDGNDCAFRVNVTKGEYDIYTDTIWINYTLKHGEKHILENDIIRLWGEVAGEKSYEAIFGNEVTLPEIDAVAIQLVKKPNQK